MKKELLIKYDTIQERTKAISDLGKEYGYDISDIEHYHLLYGSGLYVQNEEWVSACGSCLELARFLKFLRSCGNNEYKITSTIKHPQQGEVKGANISFTFNTKYMKEKLEKHITELLQVVTNQEYEFYTHNDSLKGAIDSIKRIYTKFDSKPYTSEDIQHIIDFEEKLLPKKKASKNVQIGMRIFDIYNSMEKEGIFGKSKMKEYSFLYDWCVINKIANYIGIGNSGTIGKEKYQQVKNWISAYQTYEKKLNS